MLKTESLYLKTLEITSTLQKLSHLNDVERADWANSLSGFISYDSAFDEALNALDNATTMDEANKVVKKYQNLLAVSHDNGEIFYDFIVDQNIFTSVANEKGMYIIGKYAYRILGEYILRVDTENINDLLSVYYSDIRNNTVPSEISVNRYCDKSNITQNQQNVRQNIAPIGPGGGGGGTISSWVPLCRDTTVQNENHTSLRIVKLHLRTYWQTEYLGNGTPYGEIYYANIEARGYKVSLFGAWRPYNTDVYIEGINSGTDFSVETPWGVYQYDVPISSLYTNDYILSHPDYGYSTFYDIYPGPDVYIISAHLKAWTRGTTQDYYAEINYDR